MKKLSLLILLILFAVGLKAQNCNYTYSFTPGAINTVAFTPNANFPHTIYHYEWDFGDGHTSTVAAPTHFFNSLPPYSVCYNILDSMNNIICSACDSVSTGSSATCSYNVTQGSGLDAVFNAPMSAGYYVSWSLDRGFTWIAGNPYNYIFPAPGFYDVCMLKIDSITGDTICNVCNTYSINNGTTSCSFNASLSTVSNFIYDFTANVGLFSSVTWSFGDGSSGSGLNVSHTYNSIGSYDICITVVDSFGSTCSYCDSIVVGGVHGICMFTYSTTSSALTYDFTAHSIQPHSQLYWNFGDGTTLIGGSTVTHTFPATGVYNVGVVESDSNGVVLCNYYQVVSIGLSNNCFFTAHVDSLNNNSFNFNGVPAYGHSTLAWDFGDSTFATGNSTQHTFGVAGIYTVCMSEIDSNGIVVCYSCQQITVGHNTTCSFTSSTNPFHNLTIDFQANSGFLSTVTWDFGDGSPIDSGIAVSHQYAVAGTYNVCITVYGGGAICSYCDIVTIGNTPTCSASYLSTTLGLTAYFIDMSAPPAASTTYAWDFGDGSTSSARFPQHTYAVSGTYNVCLSINAGGCTDHYCSNVAVDTSVINPTGCRAFFAIVQLSPFQVTIVNLSSGINLSFVWDFGDGSTDTQPYPSHFYANTGIYNLCLTVADASGCSDTYCDTLAVDSLGNIFRSMAGFTINVVSPSQLTGVNEINVEKNYSIYPNPVNSDLFINVKSGGNKITGYRILSLLGSELSRGNMNGFEGSVNMKDLSSGTYLLEITSSDGSHGYKSIIKN
jgi:PKD repeat protein